MWEQIVNLAISNGLFAVMFLGLFIYQLRDSKNRETKYQQIIDKLGNSLQIVKEVKDDVEMIKEKLDDITAKKKRGKAVSEEKN